jgi:hypothetical protein
MTGLDANVDTFRVKRIGLIDPDWIMSI